MVSPITASLTPNNPAAELAPLTKRFEPKVSKPIPATRRPIELSQPCFVVLTLISGSASSTPSGSSRTVLISHIVLIANATNSARPACQVTFPADAIPHTAVDTAIKIGTSLRTKRLSTFKGRTRALPPRTTNTLKMLLPTTLLTANKSDPFRTELTLTNSSGALVPSETIVNPMTSCGIPSLSAKETDPLTNSSPPRNNKPIPISTSIAEIKKFGIEINLSRQ